MFIARGLRRLHTGLSYWPFSFAQLSLIGHPKKVFLFVSSRSYSCLFKLYISAATKSVAKAVFHGISA